MLTINPRMLRAQLSLYGPACLKGSGSAGDSWGHYVLAGTIDARPQGNYGH